MQLILKSKDDWWPLRKPYFSELREQIGTSPVTISDAFLYELVLPYFIQVKKNFQKIFLENSKYYKPDGNNTYYVTYSNFYFYVDLEIHEACVHVNLQHDETEPWCIEACKELHTQLTKIQDDLAFLSLYSRVCFTQKYDKKNQQFYVALNRYISPMLLKGIKAFNCFLEDVERYTCPEDKSITTRAEDILSFYIGYNLVCNT